MMLLMLPLPMMVAYRIVGLVLDKLLTEKKLGQLVDRVDSISS